jgi:general secretion pathway protein J
MRLRDSLERRDDAAAELGMALALLRADVAAAVPLVFFAPDGGPQSAMDFNPVGSVLSLSAGGQPDIPGQSDTTDLHRIIWRLEGRDQRLVRQSWPTLYPGEEVQMSPEMVVLDGVQALSVRSFWTGNGWVNGLTPLTPVAALPTSGTAQDDDGAARRIINRYSSLLPAAIEIRLTTQAHGTLTVLESFR